MEHIKNKKRLESLAEVYEKPKIKRNIPSNQECSGIQSAWLLVCAQNAPKSIARRSLYICIP
jgi:hypothetical protein